MGIKSPVSIKVAGSGPVSIDKLTTRIESAIKAVPGVSSALGRAIDRWALHPPAPFWRR
ncbi:hypothetical protein D9M68_443510 [compost metagenome]